MKYVVVTNPHMSFGDYEHGDIAKVTLRDETGVFVRWLEIRFPDDKDKETARCRYLADGEFMSYDDLDEATAASEKERSI